MIFNMVGGSGGSGATLVVSSPANVSVTVSKDDKSYTKNSGSLGSTTFKGLATGTWTVTISGNGQTATKTIVITADYATTIAFFSATISITYPATSTCVVTNSGGQTVASDTNTGSSTKTWTAMVNATGTYTVTATATDGSGKTKSTTVNITTNGQSESVTLSYELVLVDNGSMNTDLTGDWTITKTNTWDSTGTPTITKESDHVYIYTSYGADVAVSHRTAIDLTNCNTLSINISVFQTRGTSIKVGIGTNNNDSALAVASGTLTTDGEARTITLDVSSLTGNYYFKAVSGEQITIRIYDLRIT